MNSINMEKIHDIYTDILNNGLNNLENGYNDSDKILSNRYIQNIEHNKTYIQEMNKKLENILNLSKKLIIEFDKKTIETTKIYKLREKYKDDPSKMIKIYKELNNGLSWADIAEIEDKTEDNINSIESFINTTNKDYTEYKDNKILYKKLDNIYGNKLDFIYTLPIVAKITDIPSPLYWFNGDKTNKEGVYTSLSDGTYINVPFPNILNYSNSKNKYKINKCKNSTVEECKKFRYNYNKNIKDYVYSCNFIHIGDKILKSNSHVRCSFNSRFGNHCFLNDDLKSASFCDMQKFILYNISDTLLLSIWTQKHKTINNSLNKIIKDIDICQ